MCCTSSSRSIQDKLEEKVLQREGGKDTECCINKCCNGDVGGGQNNESIARNVKRYMLQH